MGMTKVNTKIFNKRVVKTSVDREVSKARKLVEHATNTRYAYLSTILKKGLKAKQEYLKLDYITANYDINFSKLSLFITELIGKEVILKPHGKRVLVSYDNGKNFQKIDDELMNKLSDEGHTPIGSNNDTGLNYVRFKVSISPYYIMQMSYRKRWTSCTDLDGGTYMGTTITYSLLPNHFIIYGINPSGKVHSRCHVLVNKNKIVHILRVYGDNINTVLLRSLIHKLIIEYSWLEEFKVKVNTDHHGEAYKGAYIDPSVIYYHAPDFNDDPYSNKADMIDRITLYCPECGDTTSRYSQYTIVCPDCDENSITCYSCGTSLDRDEAYYYDDEPYCEECFYEYFSYCEQCGYAYSLDYLTYVRMHDAYYCEECFREHFCYCSICDDIIPIEEATTVYDGSIVCDDCLERYYTPCTECDEYIYHTDITEIDDDTQVCDDCLHRYYAQCSHCGEWVRKEELNGTSLCPDCVHEYAE